MCSVDDCVVIGIGSGVGSDDGGGVDVAVCSYVVCCGGVDGSDGVIMSTLFVVGMVVLFVLVLFVVLLVFTPSTTTTTPTTTTSTTTSTTTQTQVAMTTSTTQ